MEKPNVKTFFGCMDNCGGITIEMDEGEVQLPVIYVSMWEHSGGRSMTFFGRLRYCWQILRGEPDMDEIILNLPTAEALRDKLTEYIAEISKRKLVDPKGVDNNAKLKSEDVNTLRKEWDEEFKSRLDE